MKTDGNKCGGRVHHADVRHPPVRRERHQLHSRARSWQAASSAQLCLIWDKMFECSGAVLAYAQNCILSAQILLAFGETQLQVPLIWLNSLVCIDPLRLVIPDNPADLARRWDRLHAPVPSESYIMPAFSSSDVLYTDTLLLPTSFGFAMLFSPFMF